VNRETRSYTAVKKTVDRVVEERTNDVNFILVMYYVNCVANVVLWFQMRFERYQISAILLRCKWNTPLIDEWEMRKGEWRGGGTASKTSFHCLNQAFA